MDITANYADWIKVTFAVTSLGEPAREYYHTICKKYPNYTREECDKQFDNCLKTQRGQVSLGSLFQLAKENGVDISLPRGPRPKSVQQKTDEAKNNFIAMKKYLMEWDQFRFNLLNNRVEILEVTSNDWRPINERDLKTLYSRLRENGINVKMCDVTALIESKDFAPEYNPITEFLDSLPLYNPETDPNYLEDFFKDHLIYEDPENTDFYQKILEKWFVGMVALWTGQIEENPIMPVFCGEQHIGKTFFIRNILPPALRDYYMEVLPGTPVDKDFIISLSETVMIFMDEFTISSEKKSDVFKAVITSCQSNMRDAYAHYREVRKRRASIIGASNYQQFIKEPEGNRRYLGIKLKGTVNLLNNPLPHEEAFSQAIWMLKNGFNPKPTKDESTEISIHNNDYMIPNDCEEILKTFIRFPNDDETPKYLTAGEILKLMMERGLTKIPISAVIIGKALTRLGYIPKKINGNNKYPVMLKDDDMPRIDFFGSSNCREDYLF